MKLPILAAWVDPLWQVFQQPVVIGPARKPRPTDEERRVLERWVKYGAFGIDPADPDPGRVTVRRLNRVEYRNTVRDLTGVEREIEADGLLARADAAVYRAKAAGRGRVEVSCA